MSGNSRKSFQCVANILFLFVSYVNSPSLGALQASRDGVLQLELEDVEKLDKSKGAAATLRAEWRHDKSVTSAYWDPRGRSIVSTSYDDTLRCKSCSQISLRTHAFLTFSSSL
jgi:hypothetical protein